MPLAEPISQTGATARRKLMQGLHKLGADSGKLQAAFAFPSVTILDIYDSESRNADGYNVSVNGVPTFALQEVIPGSDPFFASDETRRQVGDKVKVDGVKRGGGAWSVNDYILRVSYSGNYSERQLVGGSVRSGTVTSGIDEVFKNGETEIPAPWPWETPDFLRRAE